MPIEDSTVSEIYEDWREADRRALALPKRRSRDD